ncbi:MAG: amidohydrolase [Bacteroidetes bacterium]|jgi:omega-amidase|nr:amidohydrolase [Bacteroidota bacterium]MBT5531364.1 amidohydrolase [Cytophagia bacterium]MBT3421659.1 amidohydrolase [Bacteroidota bacterium]MBT3932625.1 amidohydrolase [Bacteroidota bacterium]MBT4728645.1 amidohydrolase [Bacteroidota bacterium]
MQNLKIALVQVDLAWEDKEANLTKFERLINQDIPSGIDLIVLPEMFTTAFSMKPEALAESMDGQSVNWLKEQATKKNAVIVGSLIIEENGQYFNRLFWIRPDQTFETYDKRHLFTMAGEHNHYTAGNKKLIVDFKGWKFCPQICFDLRFPAWNRNNEDFDCFLLVANWPEIRIMHWTPLHIARAIENQCYVVAVNRIGDDASGKAHNGMSLAINPMGEMLTSSENKEEVLILDLNYEELRKVREKMPFLQDRDSYKIV